MRRLEQNLVHALNSPSTATPATGSSSSSSSLLGAQSGAARQSSSSSSSPQEEEYPQARELPDVTQLGSETAVVQVPAEEEEEGCGAAPLPLANAGLESAPQAPVVHAHVWKSEATCLHRVLKYAAGCLLTFYSVQTVLFYALYNMKEAPFAYNVVFLTRTGTFFPCDLLFQANTHFFGAFCGFVLAVMVFVVLPLGARRCELALNLGYPYREKGKLHNTLLGTLQYAILIQTFILAPVGCSLSGFLSTHNKVCALAVSLLGLWQLLLVLYVL